MRIESKHILLLLFFLGICRSLWAQLPEDQIKSAFVEKFTHFIEWPDDTIQNQPFVIFVFPDSPLLPFLSSLFKQHRVKSKSVHLLVTDNLNLLDSAHIVLIHQKQQHLMPLILTHIKNKPVLTIGDYPDFLEDGGILLLYKEEETLRFAINVTALSQTGLSVSSQLLKLAKLYR